MLSRDFVTQLYCTTKLQYATCMSHTATLSHKQKITNHLFFYKIAR